MNDDKSNLPEDVTRRRFLQLGGITAVGLSLPVLEGESAKTHGGTMIGVPFEPVKEPRIGIIGRRFVSDFSFEVSIVLLRGEISNPWHRDLRAVAAAVGKFRLTGLF